MTADVFGVLWKLELQSDSDGTFLFSFAVLIGGHWFGFHGHHFGGHELVIIFDFKIIHMFHLFPHPDTLPAQRSEPGVTRLPALSVAP
jgi:hypothetical protein